MVTHDPRAAAIADEVVVLADGQIVRRLDAPSEDTISATMLEVAA